MSAPTATIRELDATIRRVARRGYNLKGLAALDDATARELLRFIRDVQSDAQAERSQAVNRARIMPWRNP